MNVLFLVWIFDLVYILTCLCAHMSEAVIVRDALERHLPGLVAISGGNLPEVKRQVREMQVAGDHEGAKWVLDSYFKEDPEAAQDPSFATPAGAQSQPQPPAAQGPGAVQPPPFIPQSPSVFPGAPPQDPSATPAGRAPGMPGLSPAGPASAPAPVQGMEPGSSNPMAGGSTPPGGAPVPGGPPPAGPRMPVGRNELPDYDPSAVAQRRMSQLQP